ncbi:hypothetical protein Pmani_004811 [Petrolisthes manimaculis]|uniref:Ionotropic glutamate receptor C-terminal domain-containing protein n=1 Tax=Petrolisthes manimaculis TaxID=1843537 RepID=A0AAE1QG04_9EUCA|nr:hypothetical protein Pmani_004811 [Petrolisthes manimaculis]
MEKGGPWEEKPCIRVATVFEADMTSGLTIDMFRAQAGDMSDYMFMDEHSAATKLPKIESDIVGFLKPFTPLVNKRLLLVVIFSLLARTQHSLHLHTTPFLRSIEGGNGGEINNAQNGHKKPNNQTNQPNNQTNQLNKYPNQPNNHPNQPNNQTNQPNPPKNINRDAIFWAVCTLLAQSVPLQSPRGGVVKSVTGLWLILSLILATVYRSNLKAMLILPKITLPFNNIEELTNANIPVWAAIGSSMHRAVYFADPDSVLGRLNKTIYNAGQPQNKTWGIQGMVLGEHVAVVPRYTILQIMNTLFSKTGRCSIYIMRESYLKTGILSFIYKKGSPLRTRFNDLLGRLREAGIVEHFYQQSVANTTKCLKTYRPESLRPLSLEDFYGVFLIFFGGLEIAFCCFLLEFIMTSIVRSRYRSPHHHNLNPNPQLLIWPRNTPPKHRLMENYLVGELEG